MQLCVCNQLIIHCDHNIPLEVQGGRGGGSLQQPVPILWVSILTKWLWSNHQPVFLCEISIIKESKKQMKLQP